MQLDGLLCSSIFSHYSFLPLFIYNVFKIMKETHALIYIYSPTRAIISFFYLFYFFFIFGRVGSLMLRAGFL